MTGPENQPRKPIVLSVDDDPSVSRAVARDLRRHYGEKYRIVRAESGPDALDTLKELKLRGDTVAVFVADYRMPQMSGIEFLEQAMDVFPRARRVLLTAYADTHAAIDAINVVDLDHYLLKPWDPPEEKLYPVIDALLEAWSADGEHPIADTKIIGHRWNRRVLGGPGLPGPQPVVVPLDLRRRRRGQAHARGGEPGRPAIAGRDHRRRANRLSSRRTPNSLRGWAFRRHRRRGSTTSR